MRSPRTDESEVLRPVTRGMQAVLVVAGVLVLLAGLQLFVFSEDTARFFAWTIAEPLTAAVLGAAYWASVVIELSAARARLWADARISVPTVVVFSTLTLVVTLLHLDKFHLGPEHELATRLATWAWIAIYVAVPVLLGGLWFSQSRLPGGDPPRRRRLPRWVALMIALQAAVLLPAGGWLLLTPLSAARAWPWPLTALTAQALGAWALSLGVVAVHALREDDPVRVRPAALASVALAVLQAAALARYGDAMRWDSFATIAFVGSLVLAALSGVGTLLAARREVARD